MDRYAPVKHIKIGVCDKFREPWVTVKLKKYDSKCRRLCNKARITGVVSDFEKYRLYRKTLNRLKFYMKREVTTMICLRRLVKILNYCGM